MPLLCAVPSQKSIFCCADFGSTIAVDLQQKLKPFLHSSKKQMALQSFLGIYSFFVKFRIYLRLIFVISSVFIRFVFRIYTFSCGTVLPPSKISSSCRSVYLYLNSFCYSKSNHTLWTKQARSIQWTQGLFMPFWSCHFPSNTKHSVLTSMP